MNAMNVRVARLGNTPARPASAASETGLTTENASTAAKGSIFNRLAVILITSILGISVLGSIFGVLLARRISRPLVKLSESAASFSLGDLVSPVKTETRVREITQVARTLENARIDLLATLTSLQSERDWSDHLLASIVEGIVTLDEEGRVTFFSHGAERVTGWKKEKVMGHLIDDIFHLAGSD